MRTPRFLPRNSLLIVLLLISTLPGLRLNAAGSSVGSTVLLSRDATGRAAGGSEPQLTAGGKVVVFSSSAALSDDDGNGWSDIYLVDSSSAQRSRISVGADAAAQRPAVSADGMVIAYDSAASTLAADDSNGAHDIFVYDVKHQRTLLVSRSDGGSPGNAGSFSPAVSANGRVIAFDSNAANLVTDDRNAVADVFVVDLVAGKTERISLNSSGSEANGPSFEPVLSADGRYVAFHSSAANLIANDTNGVSDIFVHDRLTGQTVRVSVGSFGGQANAASYGAAISADGMVIAFDSAAANLSSGDVNGQTDIFVHDRTSGITTLASHATAGLPADGPSYRPALSADGRIIAFSSQAANLVISDNNGQSDVFVHDLQTRDTTRVSVRNRGGEADQPSSDAAVSADGSLIAFVSTAGTLVSNDTNARADVFLHQLEQAPAPIGGATRVSISSSGQAANGNSYRAAISANGRVIAFDSDATNLVDDDSNGQVDVFVRDLDSNRTTRISLSSSGGQGNGGSYSPSVSADGQIIAFDSNAANLVAGDTNNAADVFVHDRSSGITTRISIGSAGIQGNSGSYLPSISGDGRYIAFHSVAANLVTGDTNNTFDVFVHDRQTRQTRLVSRAGDGSIGNGGSYTAALSGDGQVVTFDSNASNLVKDDTNGQADIFVHTLADGVTERVSLTAQSGQADAASLEPAISADGQLVVFYSHATNLVEDDTNRVADIFIRDRLTQTTKRISLATGGIQSNGASGSPTIARDGRYVVFSSSAVNLSKADSNNTVDIFLHDRESGVTTRISVAAGGGESNGWSGTPAVADGASLVVFDAAAGNLSDNDSNGRVDIFLRDAAPPTAFAPSRMLRMLFLPAIDS